MTDISIEPTHVTIEEACRLSGDEARTGIYNALGRGELRAIKRGRRILVELASIRERLAKCPPAKLKRYRTTADYRAECETSSS